MDLRAPPSPTVRHSGSSTTLITLNIIILAVVVGGFAWSWFGGKAGGNDGGEVNRTREIASKLKAAGAMEEAAALYGVYLEDAGNSASLASRASIAYSLGQIYLEGGQYERALRWFYEAESLGAGPLAEQVSQKIVHSLESLGRMHAAQAALNARVSLDDAPEDAVKRPDSDPVVARIGKDEILRSDIDRALDELPPELRKHFAGDAQRNQFVRKYVADELLWRKAQKLEYQNDPEVRRQLEGLLKQLVVAKFIEKEVLGKITVDAADLQTFHEANRVQYDQRDAVKLQLIKVANAKTANRISAELRAGKSFASLAKQHSLHAASKKAGGKIGGWVSRGDDFLSLRDQPAVIVISDAVFALDMSKSKVSEPVIVGGYAYLFQILDKRPGKERPLQEVRAQVEQDYRRMKMQSAYMEMIEQQLQSEDVEILGN